MRTMTKAIDFENMTELETATMESWLKAIDAAKDVITADELGKMYLAMGLSIKASQDARKYKGQW